MPRLPPVSGKVTAAVRPTRSMTAWTGPIDYPDRGRHFSQQARCRAPAG